MEGDCSEWRVPRSKRPHRRRILCPTLAVASGEQVLRDGSLPKLPPMQRSLQPSPSLPLSVCIRVLYFAHDGTQADTGNLLELQVSTSTTCEVLLRHVREAVGCGEKGRLLFRMRPLDANATLEMSGIHKDPKALHFLLNRKHRPPEVVERANREAAELSAAMAVAAAEAAARPRRRRQSPRPVSGGSMQSDPPQLT
ncbi:unnamed protein product [Symbiodinium sp. CCMP2592]|nr:unnamed protein product [Symbiodinium sp. CCMP2592]